MPTFFALDNVNPTAPINTNVANQGLFPNTPTGGSTGQVLLGNFLGRGRTGVWKRQVMTWNIPNRLESIQMYINPQNMDTRKQKLIHKVRTRRGFVNQYWGEDLDVISLSGTTGSGGIEGINILNDIYRAEQGAIEGIGEALIRRIKSGNFNDFVSGDVFRNVKNIGDLLNNGESISLFGNNDNPQNLAEIAFNIRMTFQGVTYRGYFNTFSFNETAENPGWFRYQMEFVVVETFGVRTNFMPWHRSAHVGPANSDIVPLTYSNVSQGASVAVRAGAEALAGTLSALAGVQGVQNARGQLLSTFGGGGDTPPAQTGRVANTSQIVNRTSITTNTSAGRNS